MKNLLLSLDLKNSDNSLIDQGKLMAKKFDAKLWIVHIAAPDPDFVGYEPGPQYIRDERADTLKAEHKELHRLSEDFNQAGINAEALLIAGSTVETIQEEVKKLAIDMLIMGSHKHGFLYENFVGNTASKLINTIEIPLLIVPIDD